MKKAELVRNISKAAGVPDTEAKVFFEIFLRKTANLLKPGQTFKLRNVGFFNYRKARIKSKVVSHFDETPEIVYLDLLLFSEKDDFSKTTTDYLIFNVPQKESIDYNPVDSLFSISIGKPIIPLKDIKQSDYLMPPTGIELRRLIESKAEKLIKEIELLEEPNEFDPIIVLDKSNYDPAQIEFEWEDKEILNYDTVPESNDDPINISKNKEFENLTWDFGEQLAREIEEESLMDLEPESGREMLSGDETSLWNFGAEDYYQKNESALFTEGIDDTSKSPEEPEQKEMVKEVEDYSPEEEVSKLREQENEIEMIGSFQRVRSLTQELDSSFRIPKHHTKVIEENEAEEFIEKETSSDQFDKYPAESFSQTTEFFITEDDQFLSSSTEAIEDETPEVEESPEELPQQPDEEETKDFHKSAVEEAFSYASRKRERGYDRSGKKSATIVFGLVFLMILIAGAIYFFNKLSSGVDPAVDRTFASINIIERNYDLPVSYPYPKKDAKQVMPEEQPVAVDEPVIPDKLETVRGNIFKSPTDYVVQVGSFRREQDADVISERLKGKGFSSYVEEANITTGRWYRVRVRGFNSTEEAENFFNRYQRNEF